MKEMLKNKKKTITLIILIVVIVAALGVILYGYQYNNKQTELLTQEAQKLNNLNIETDEIDMEIKTKGKYAIIEETMKKYLNETKKTCSELIDLCTKSDLDKILSSENIKEDGPEFITTKEKITNFKTQVNEYIEKCNNLINEENIKNAINNKNLEKKYEELYRELMLDEHSKETLYETKESLNNSAEKINKSLDKMLDILNFLSENKDSWEVVNDKIQFKNITKLTEYYKVINE